MMTYRKERDRNLLVAGRWSWIGLLSFACGVSPVIKSGSATFSPDRQMFRREKKAIFPFILFGLFDPEGLGAETRRPANPAGGRTPYAPINHSVSISSFKRKIKTHSLNTLLIYILLVIFNTISCHLNLRYLSLIKKRRGSYHNRFPPSLLSFFFCITITKL